MSDISSEMDLSKALAPQDRSSHSDIGQRGRPLLSLECPHVVEASNIRYSDLIPLNGAVLALNNPQLQLLELTPTEERPMGMKALYLFEQQEGEQRPVGYITFNWNNGNQTEAHISINYARTKSIQDIKSHLPQSLIKAIDQGRLLNAFEVADSVKGKGLGKLLWLAGVAKMRDHGFERITITGDHTGDGRKPTDSFYMKYGAYMDKSVFPPGK